MEMNQQTLARMSQMRLLGMHATFRTSMESFKSEGMTTDQFVAWLVENEWDDRTKPTYTGACKTGLVPLPRLNRGDRLLP